ncbi:coiled-coil domain-containing protein 144A-like isoform X14 [Sapajus apella]|uniref:Coiled-coil domain-containing protein 144A-like isoform X14 n=1 Tax=Sapajus apella TaxID=9515 RepID=A0A6J3GMU6_SAPAP|nr:coiled-coil domain-containing protein 144A-like isoform X14 [Sapajus apella]
MRKTFRGGIPEDPWSSGSLTSCESDSLGGGSPFAPPRYRVHLEDLDELHRAAWRGDVPGVERVLVPGGPGVDKRDKKNRTALHLACVSGHPAVVALLVDRKCQLNCFDSYKRTALIKAVQCRQEECATILLKQGADPDLPDIYGNTALHYAVHNEDQSLAEKLLLYSTNMEAENENGLTPLLFAISGKRQQMVEFFLERAANLLAVNKCQRTALILAVQCGSANIVSRLLQQNIDISSQDMFGRTAEDYAIFNQFTGIQQLISEYKEKQTPKSLPQNNNPEQEKMNIGVVLLSGNNTVHDMCQSQLPENKESKEDWHPTNMTDSDKTCERSKNLKVDKCLPVSPSMSKKQSDTKELGQTNLIEQEKMNIGAVFLSGNNTFHDVCQSQLPENKESKEEEQDLELPSEEEEERLKGRENKQPQVEEEMKQHTSNNTELLGSLPDGTAAGSDDDGLNQQFPRKENEVHDRPENKTPTENNKVKNQIHSGADFADSMQSSETASECELSHSTYENFLLLIEQLKMECKDSVSRSRIKDAFHLYEHLLELKNNDCERLRAEIKQMGNTVSVLQKELSETKETKLQLEHQKIEWEQELGSLRLALRQEKYKKENADVVCNKVSEQLRIKEEECRKKAEMTQQLKWTLRKLIKELRMVEQQRNDAQQQLSEEQNARILQDQILTSEQKEPEMAQKKMDSEVFSLAIFKYVLVCEYIF